MKIKLNGYMLDYDLYMDRKRNHYGRNLDLCFESFENAVKPLATRAKLDTVSRAFDILNAVNFLKPKVHDAMVVFDYNNSPLVNTEGEWEINSGKKCWWFTIVCDHCIWYLTKVYEAPQTNVCYRKKVIVETEEVFRL